MKKNDDLKKAAILVGGAVVGGLVLGVAVGGIQVVCGINSIFGEKLGGKMVEVFMAAGKKAISGKS